MQLATVAFHRLLGLLASVSISLSLKVLIWNATVCPVLLYGYGARGLTAIPLLRNYVFAFHFWHLRIMAGYRWLNEINIETLYKLTRSQ